MRPGTVNGRSFLRLRVALLATVAALALPASAAADHTPGPAWGAPVSPAGDAAGEVKDPSGIDADALDNVYIADYGNNRVQKFSSDGDLMTGWGTNGAVSGFNQPVDVAVTASGELYVADRANNRIRRFSATGVLLGEWPVAGPRAVATDGSGNVYVVGLEDGPTPANNVVRKFDATGNAGTPATFGLGQYTGVDVTGATVLVTDYDNDEVERWTTAGVAIDTWGTATLDGPSDVAVTEGGANVFVADSLHNRVVRFTLGGASPSHVLGAGNGTLANPQGVATGSLDTVFVSDTEGSRIVKYAAPPPNSTVRVSGTRIVFEGDASPSVATVTLTGAEYTFVDTGDSVTRGAGCTQDTANSVKCDVTGVGVTSLRFLMGAGDDTVTVNPTTPTTIEGAAGDDRIIGSSGPSDTVSYANAPGPVAVTLGALPDAAQNTVNAGNDRLTGIDGITGSDAGDVLTGSVTANTLTGGDGDDVLAGAGGDDVLAGGVGDDRADYSGAGPGGVTVDLSNTASQATGAAGSDALSGIENLTGSAQGDTLSGSSASNRISGGDGPDVIHVEDTGPDEADCGGGADTATADPQDTTPGCETVTIAGGSGGGGGGGGGGGAGGGTPAPAPGAGGGGGGGATTPVITGLGAAKMRSGKAGSFRYTLSLAARVTLTIERPGPGRKSGKACKKQTKRNRKAKKCTFYAPVATLTHAGKVGPNTAPFSGKPGGRAMKPGGYRVTAVAVSAGGARSASVSAKFTVTR